MSKSRYITLSSSIPIYNVLFEHLENLLDKNSSNFCLCSEICTTIKKDIKNLNYIILKQTNQMFIP